MNLVTREELKSVLATATGPFVSVYLPTHQFGPEIQQDFVKLNALIDQAEAQLIAGGLRSPEAIALLQPARTVVDNTPFWQHQQAGLALLLAPDFYRYYCLPVTVDELVVVGDRFHVKPLFAMVEGEERFYVLTLSQNAVQLFEGNRHHLSEVKLQELPENLAEALHYDQFERQQQFHTKTPALAGKRAAIFHGHSTGTDDKGENLRHYLLQIDRSLHQVLRDEQAPLVVASVEYLLSVYRKVNTYPHLLETGLTGNPETLTTAELQQQAWALVQPYFRQAQRAAGQIYEQLAHTDQTSSDLREILMAAYQGRVATLWVTLSRQQWGRYDLATNRLDLHQLAQPGDEELFDTAAVQTFRHGGTVYVVAPDQVPAGASLAAVFRY
jgi:hypothetical protein